VAEAAPQQLLLGWTIGPRVDEQDHVWVIHRGVGGLHNNERGAELNPPIADCCRTAPPILVFDPVHCIERSVDDLIYACDRQNDRLQVFEPDGTFVKEQFYARNTRAQARCGTSCGP
jgi:hypothetical protein